MTRRSKMLARYRAVYAVQTISVPSGSPLNVEIAHEDDPRTVACLVSDPRPYCEEIFAWAVIAEDMMTGMFAGKAPSGSDRVLELAQQKAASRLGSFPSGRAYLAVDGSYQIEEPQFNTFRNEIGDPFGVAFHDTLGPELSYPLILKMYSIFNGLSQYSDAA